MVNDVETGTNCLIDLDAGMISSLPASIKFEDVLATQGWYRKTGIDVSGRARGWPSLCGRDLISHMVREDRWNNLTAAEVGDFVERYKPPYGVPEGSGLGGSIGTDIPTFLFKTREGGVGLLQITGLADDPRGVKIRYKLVQMANAQSGKTLVLWNAATDVPNSIRIETASGLLPGEALATVTRFPRRSYGNKPGWSLAFIVVPPNRGWFPVFLGRFQTISVRAKVKVRFFGFGEL